MDFIHSVQNIQQKPRHVRQRILFISVGVSMAIVVISWLMVTSRRIDADMFHASKTQMEASASPFDMLRNIIMDITESVRAQF